MFRAEYAPREGGLFIPKKIVSFEIVRVCVRSVLFARGVEKCHQSRAQWWPPHVSLVSACDPNVNDRYVRVSFL